MKKIIFIFSLFTGIITLIFAFTPTLSIEAQSHISPKILTTSGPGEPTRLQAYSKATTDGANSLLDNDITGLFPEAYTGGAGIVPLDQNNNGVLNQFLIFAINNGGPQARVMGLNPDGSLSTLGQMFVFDDYIRDGLSATSGDFDGDGFQDDAAFCLTGDYNPRVKVFRDVSGIDNWELINQFDAAFGANGCNLGTFQYDDGAEELLVTPNHGVAEPKVWVYTVGGTLKKDFWAYDAPINQGLTATGIEDRIFTTPNNGSSQVNAFNRAGERKNFWWVYEQHVRGDFTIRAGQLDPSDDKEELLISPIGSNGPHVLGYRASGVQKPTPNFFAFDDPGLRNGVGIAVIEDWHGGYTDGDNSDGHEGSRLQPSNLSYLGAFLLPNEFDWGARGITYYPKGSNGAGSLLVTGFELPRNNDYEECTDPDNCFAYYGEVNIPTPKIANNFEDASLATLQGNVMHKLDDGRACFGDCQTTWISDIEYVTKTGTQISDKLYASRTLWYAEGDLGTDTFPTIWFTNFNGSNVQGLFNVGNNEDPFHGRKMGDYLFSVPDWYANKYLGGRTLVTGRSRGTPGVIGSSNTSAGSQGPTMFAFKPFSSDTASGNIDALPMLYYRTFFPECAGPNVGDKKKCDYPDFTMNDIWTGASFVEAGSKRAIMLQGIKGLGTNCYDDADGSGIICNDPCSDAHGYHCNPYERQVIFYDVDQIGQITQGEIDPWKVLPYQIWRPEEFFFDGQTCSSLGGMAFDRDNNKLYMIEKGLDGFNNINRAAVHVYDVN